MVMFHSFFCKRLPEGKPPFSYGFPMVFPWVARAQCPAAPVAELQQLHIAARRDGRSSPFLPGDAGDALRPVSLETKKFHGIS